MDSAELSGADCSGSEPCSFASSPSLRRLSLNERITLILACESAARGGGPSTQAPAVLALHLALDVAVADLAPTVTLLLAACQRQLHLRPRALEVDPGRDQGQTAPLAATHQAL